MSDGCGDDCKSVCVGSEGIDNGEDDDGENGDDIFVASLGGSSVAVVLDGRSAVVVLGLGFLENAPLKQFMSLLLGIFPEEREGSGCGD